MSTLYTELETRIAAWARTHPDIYAVLIVGSRARIEPPPDRWSDLDLILFADHPQPYIDDAAWLGEFGTVLLRVLDIMVGHEHEPEWLVFYEEGHKLDFLFIPTRAEEAAQGAEALLAASGNTDIYARGARILIDRSDPPAEGRLVQGPRRVSELPSQDEFNKIVELIWHEALKAAKFIRRGDHRWRATNVINSRMNEHLLTLIEWHARTVYGADHDVWYGGRFLEQWADPSVAEAIPQTVASYEADGLWSALFATLNLAHRLTAEIAEHLHYDTLTDKEAKVMRLITVLREG